MTVHRILPPRRSPFDQPELLREMREEDHLSTVTTWDGRQVWYVTRYADACRVLRDSRFSVVTANGLPELSPGRDKTPGTLGRTDEPRHRELRRMLADEFLVKRIEALRPSIEHTVATQVGQLLSTTPPVDFHAAFSMGIPAETVGSLLGAPPDARQTFRRCLATLTDRTTTATQKSVADKELYSCCRQLVEQKVAEPGDDVISRCMTGPLRDGRMHPEEAYRTTVQLVSGGHDTTAATITSGVLTMLVKPEWRQALREQPETAPHAVEELLRYHTPMTDGLPRVALEDVVVGGTLVRAGDGLLVCVASANRDEREFDRPDELDVDRQAARRHLAFGHGVHRCIGQWLARAEIQAAISAVATEIPTLRLAVPLDSLVYGDSFIAGVRELPVTW
ncbi:MAG TPA: cytochrome P450 [Pseudonocardiaceae bacterium]|nr:cytochrome P450 [Pseudonocardiaceae bacterium]